MSVLSTSTRKPGTGALGASAEAAGARLRRFCGTGASAATGTTTGAAGNTYDWQSGQGEAATPAVLADGNVNVLSFRFYRIQITAATGAGYAVATIMQ